MKKPKTQKQQVKEHLKDGNSITPIEELERFGCFRLASIICRLRDGGMSIKTSLTKNSHGHSFAKYTIDNTVSETNWRSSYE